MEDLNVNISHQTPLVKQDSVPPPPPSITSSCAASPLFPSSHLPTLPHRSLPPSSPVLPTLPLSPQWVPANANTNNVHQLTVNTKNNANNKITDNSNKNVEKKKKKKKTNNFHEDDEVSLQRMCKRARGVSESASECERE